MKGAGGQSFGAFYAKGSDLDRCAVTATTISARDFPAASCAVSAQEKAKFKPEENIIIGNVALYGATSGKAYIGRCGRRTVLRPQFRCILLLWKAWESMAANI